MPTERFEESKNIIGGIAYPAHKCGRIVYEAPEEVKRELYERWVRKADEDLAVPEHLLLDEVPYFGSIRFPAQQAAESF